MEKDFREFLELLLAHGVEFMIVGGFAVALHGFPRYTEDLDVLIARNEENAEKLMSALREFGFGNIGLSIVDFLNPDRVVQLGRVPVRIDIITSMSGIKDYEQLFASSRIQDLDGLNVKIISLDNLIVNKKASGRDQDKVDARRLLTIKSQKKNKDLLM
jgi:predicted nucleotidyltransferase